MEQVQILNQMVDKLALKVAIAEKRSAYLEAYAEGLEAQNAELKANLQSLLEATAAEPAGE